MDRGEEQVTFSFGENWNDYLDHSARDAFLGARQDIETWLGADAIRGKAILDVGSGSGIHSRAFLSLGARSVVSFDADPASVRTTHRCWEQAGRPEGWTVTEGSILDNKFVLRLGKFDVVYAWGVLHHTGRMWDALTNTFDLAARGGRVWISIYTKGPKYPRHLAMKRRYNAASGMGKWWLLRLAILRSMAVRVYRRQNPFTWNQSQSRGMNVYHNLVDWLGGLPYEVASADEVVQFAALRGLVLERINPVLEGRCSTYVFRRTADQGENTAGARGVEAA